MPDSFQYTFSGSIEEGEIEFHSLEAVSMLQGSTQEIESELRADIQQRSGMNAAVSIEFRRGSLDWSGLVELWPAVKQSAQAMATAGGAIAFLHIVRTAINAVLRKWFRRLFQTNIDPRTFVVLVSAPEARSEPRRRDVAAVNLFGIAAVIASLAALVASIATVIFVLRGLG